MTTETVDEEDGVVEICVVVKSPTIQCPIVYPVDFIVEITDIDTSMYSILSPPSQVRISVQHCFTHLTPPPPPPHPPPPAPFFIQRKARIIQTQATLS